MNNKTKIQPQILNSSAHLASDSPQHVCIDGSGQCDPTNNICIFFESFLKSLKIILHLNSPSAQFWVPAYVLMLKGRMSHPSLVELWVT